MIAHGPEILKRRLNQVEAPLPNIEGAHREHKSQRGGSSVEPIDKANINARFAIPRGLCFIMLDPNQPGSNQPSCDASSLPPSVP